MPKDLLCYYPNYFDRCFNGSFEEGKEQTLYLPDEDPKLFALLMDYVLRETTTAYLSWLTGLRELQNFIAFANKYDLAEAASIFSKSLERIFIAEESLHQGEDRNYDENTYSGHKFIDDYFIEVIFDHLPRGHVLRDLVVKAAVRHTMVSDGGINYSLKKYRLVCGGCRQTD
jgi:hypothetical protein